MTEWTCHVCGETRPDTAISVRKSDISERFNLPAGTVGHNVRYNLEDRRNLQPLLDGLR